MKRYYLSLKAGYLPGWGLYEGVRELVQNARDAEVQYDAKMKVEFVFRQRDKKPVGTIIVSNEGTTIPKEAFLIGHTSKTGRSDLIGKFGEGLKFGILALLRIPGIEVKIRNGDETWNPVIAQAKDYDADVLAFDVADGNKFENRVQIEVVGVSPEDWAKIQEKFLFITPPNPGSTIKVSGGQILLAPQYKGMVFVKGMFVCKFRDLHFGYDVEDADIDRDRRMVNDMNKITGRLLAAAMANGKLLDKIYDLMISGSAETSAIYSASLGEEQQDAIVNKFHEQHGEKALPVDSDDQVKELGHLGVKGVRLPWNLSSIISARLGSASTNIIKLKTSARHTFELSDLTDNERRNLESAQEIMRICLRRCSFEADLADKVTIVEFNDPQMRGTFSPDERMTRLARHRLAKVSTTLQTMIHEIAHTSGADGSKQHESAIGELTEHVFSMLLEN